VYRNSAFAADWTATDESACDAQTLSSARRRPSPAVPKLSTTSTRDRGRDGEQEPDHATLRALPAVNAAGLVSCTAHAAKYKNNTKRVCWHPLNLLSSLLDGGLRSLEGSNTQLRITRATHTGATTTPSSSRVEHPPPSHNPLGETDAGKEAAPLTKKQKNLGGIRTTRPLGAMGEVWEGWYTVGVVVVAFVCLLWDLIQPDHVMIGALAMLMAAGVVSVEEGLAGFANEGLLTVAALFVVAAGISATGGLDWYMGKLLGHPRTIAGAQLRLMLPIAAVSGFLNNTPVVAVMIPIVQRWAENIQIPKEQVMIPLSFASILGGTCTLIGTSTNLVVLGMLNEWTGSDGAGTTKHTMGLFDLGLYGVPCALSGMCYILLASRSLLPGGRAAAASRSNASAGGGEGGRRGEDLIVGARLQPWSGAVGKTVAGSGLRGLPGLYLVSVKRDNVLMRAVGPEFVLSQGDILYFTGMVESLGTVCAEYGLMAMTSEHDSDDEMSDNGDSEASGGVNGGGVKRSGSHETLYRASSGGGSTSGAGGATRRGRDWRRRWERGGG
jgi:hypothetical protein